MPELALAVRHDARGAGIASALLDELVALAREMGLAGLSLSVASDNPARRLYERAGFVKVAQADSAWTMLLRL